jgi:hypothetical protein
VDIIRFYGRAHRGRISLQLFFMLEKRARPMALDQVHAPCLIHNAKIYRFDDEDSIADAILIGSGRVLAVGRMDDFRQQTSSRLVETWDLHGATVLPV